jgi:hypothetical protein
MNDASAVRCASGRGYIVSAPRAAVVSLPERGRPSQSGAALSVPAVDPKRREPANESLNVEKQAGRRGTSRPSLTVGELEASAGSSG